MNHTTTGVRHLVGALLALLAVAGACGDAKDDPASITVATVTEEVATDLTTDAGVVVTTVDTMAPTTTTTTTTSVAVTTTVPFPDIDEELSEFDDLASLLDELDDLLGDSLEGEDS